MAKPLHAYRAVRTDPSGHREVQETVAVERPLKIMVNGEVFTILMHMPGSEEALVRGLLFTEGLITRDTAVEVRVNSETGMDEAQVTLPGLDTESVINKRSLLSATSCGICGTRELVIPSDEALQVGELDTSIIPRLIPQMKDAQQAFSETGAVHAAALFSAEGELLALCEDVGRHNAADKAIGRVLTSGKLADCRFMVLSGRVSYEMVAKAFKARIPVIAAVSAPTSMAVDFCLEWGIALFGFCRGDRFTRYA